MVGGCRVLRLLGASLMDPRLPVWVQSSVSVYLKPIAESLRVRFFVEGVDEEFAEAFQQDSALLRVDGPVVKPYHGEMYSIQVQVVLTDLVTPSKNSYRHLERCGTFASALDLAIPVYKYGDGDELLACLVPEKGRREGVVLTHFGQVDKDVKVRQSALLCHYELSY